MAGGPENEKKFTVAFCLSLLGITGAAQVKIKDGTVTDSPGYRWVKQSVGA